MQNGNNAFSWRSIVLVASAIAPAGPLVHLMTAAHFSWREALVHLFASLVFSNSIALGATGLCVALWPRLCCDSTWKALSWAAILLAVADVAGSLFATAVLMVVRIFPASEFWGQYFAALRFATFMTFTFGAGAWALEYLRERLQKTTLELRTHQLERERIEKLATEAQLASLESRIHPHFLFNALNSISSLIREDPGEAERMVGRMAALLRFSLDSGRVRLVPIEQEIRVVTDYLEIERARFGPRLRYFVDLPPALGDVQVPPLSVQTLVENAIKYAVAPRREGGSVRIGVRDTGASIAVTVADDGPGFTSASIEPGHGIENVESRLRALCGPDSRIAIERDGTETRVGFAVPHRSAEAVA